MLFAKAARRRNVAPPARPWTGSPPEHSEVKLATMTYFATIALGPLPPLFVYVTRRRTSPFLHWHAVQALNVALTGALYGLCLAIVGGLLSLDKLSTALGVAIPVLVIGWAIVGTHLARAAMAASRAGYVEIPAWICSPFVTYRQ